MVSRMSEEGLKSLAENESKMDAAAQWCQNSSIDHLKEVQLMLDLARAEGTKLNGGYSFINLTLMMGIHVLGRKSIEQVVVWDQKEKRQ